MGKGKEVEYKGRKIGHDELAGVLLMAAICEFVKVSGREPSMEDEGFHESLMGVWLNEMSEALESEKEGK
jgi:hypothetical protein